METAAPSIDVHAADPRVKLRREREAVDVKASRPEIDVHDIITAEVVEAMPVGADILGERLTPSQMRRAVVLSELLRSPLALRGAGGWTPGAF